MSCATGLHIDEARALVARARVGFGGGMHQPVADRTISIGAMLKTTARDSGRVAMRLARPSLIVGFHAAVFAGPPELNAGPPKSWPQFLPRLDDVLVTMDVGRTQIVTSSPMPSAGVPLGAMVLPQRAHMLLVEGANPELGFTFASIYGTDVGSGMPEPVGVLLSAYIIEIGD